MPGLISKVQNPDEPDETIEATPTEGPAEESAEEEAPAPAAPGPSGELTPQTVRANMKLPPNLQKAYDKVVLAGMKMMFSPETHEAALQTIQGDGPVADRLAQGVAALMGLLVEKSNGTMPPQIIIPAATELLVAAGDYLKKSGGEPVTDQDIGAALGQLVQIILDQAGVSEEQLPQMLNQFKQGGGAVAGAQAVPGQPPMQPAPQPPQGA